MELKKLRYDYETMEARLELSETSMAWITSSSEKLKQRLRRYRQERADAEHKAQELELKLNNFRTLYSADRAEWERRLSVEYKRRVLAEREREIAYREARLAQASSPPPTTASSSSEAALASADPVLTHGQSAWSVSELVDITHGAGSSSRRHHLPTEVCKAVCECVVMCEEVAREDVCMCECDWVWPVLFWFPRLYRCLHASPQGYPLHSHSTRQWDSGSVPFSQESLGYSMGAAARKAKRRSLQFSALVASNRGALSSSFPARHRRTASSDVHSLRDISDLRISQARLRNSHQGAPLDTATFSFAQENLVGCLCRAMREPCFVDELSAEDLQTMMSQHAEFLRTVESRGQARFQQAQRRNLTEFIEQERKVGGKLVVFG
jgi:hypothetical protein